MIGELFAYGVAACYLAVAMWHGSDAMQAGEEASVRRRRALYLRSLKRGQQ